MPEEVEDTFATRKKAKRRTFQEEARQAKRTVVPDFKTIEFEAASDKIAKQKNRANAASGPVERQGDSLKAQEQKSANMKAQAMSPRPSASDNSLTPLPTGGTAVQKDAASIQTAARNKLLKGSR